MLRSSALPGVPHDLFHSRPLSAHRALGIGVASYSMAIGLYCDGAVRANTGVTLTQGFPNPRNNYLAINLLAQGHTAGQALTELISDDRDSEYRQIAMVDRDNNAVA